MSQVTKLPYDVDLGGKLVKASPPQERVKRASKQVQTLVLVLITNRWHHSDATLISQMAWVWPK